jgi:hypothetical protein
LAGTRRMSQRIVRLCSRRLPAKPK